MKKFLAKLVFFGALAVGAAFGQHTFPALDTNNPFTGQDTFSIGIGLGSVTQAGLTAGAAYAGAGTLIFCSNCQQTSPCTNAGTGALAQYNGSVWNCGSSGGGGGGITVSVNGSATGLGSNANFSNSTPAAGAGQQNVTFQTDGLGNISAEFPVPTTFNGRGPGAILPVLTDYQGMQQVGSGTMQILCNATGTCTIGNSGNFLELFPTSGLIAFLLQSNPLNAEVIAEASGGQTLTSIQAGIGNNSAIINLLGNSNSITPAIQIQLGGICSSSGICIGTTSTTFSMPITVPSCIGCGTALPDPFQFNSSLPVSLLASVVGKSGLRFDPTDGTLYMVDKALTTSDPWGQVVVAQQSGASGNINSKGLIDQVPVGISTGQFQFDTLPNGAVKYTTSGGGFSQASAADLTNGAPGSGQVCLRNGCILVAPSLGAFTATSGAFSGSGATQLDMSYSGVAPTSPTAGHNYIAVDSTNNLKLSINGGNYFQPGPSSAILAAMCGGTLGTGTPATGYIFFPAQQSTTTCTATATGSATVIELPFPANGTAQNLFCTSNGGGFAGDTIKLFTNNTVTTLSATMGTSTTGHDTTHTVTISQGDIWSLRYIPTGGTDGATGMRCQFEYVRTP